MPQEVNTDGLGLVHAGLESKKKKDEATAQNLHNTINPSCPNLPTSHEDTAEQRSVTVLSLANQGTSPSQWTQFEQLHLRS